MEISRRELGYGVLAGLSVAGALRAGPLLAAGTAGEPWYRRVKRWSQINFTENDPAIFDLSFWRQYWKDSRTQGVILNAGGDIAFYPTAIAEQERAELLGNRDFYGDVASACRQDGLVVMARLAYRGTDKLKASHPEWLAVDANGKPKKLFCMNGDYTYKHCASILREIGERYRPDGYTLSGWGANYGLCYCPTCASLFREASGHDLPRARDWDDPAYRKWLEWNTAQIVAHWDNHNRIARETGGEDCIWVGQILYSIATRGMRELCERSPFTMIDYQSRNEAGGFEDAATAGKVLNGLVQWKKPIAQAIGLYQGVRLTSSPSPEWGSFMRQAVSSGIRPWWHTVGSYSEDKRRYRDLPQVMAWHAKNERYLFDRTPVATVGLVWSDQNSIYFGRDQAFKRVQDPWLGMTQALTRHRIPFVAVHIDDIDRDAQGLRTLILPNLGAISDEQAASIRRFVARGGGLFATGETSLYDKYGEPRSDYALGDLFGAHRSEQAPTPPLKPLKSPPAYLSASSPVLDLIDTLGVPVPNARQRGAAFAQESYFRLSPELRAGVYGPHNDKEPVVAPGTMRHPVLAGLEATDIVIFGGPLDRLAIDPAAEPLLTYVPPITSQPPESSWMRTDRTDIAGLVVRELENGSRVAFMPASLDRLYLNQSYPDHGLLLANAARWTAGDDMPLRVDGPGSLDCSLFRQPGRMIAQIQNLSGIQGIPPATEFLPVGPVRVRVRLDKGVAATRARCLVSEASPAVRKNGGWAEVTLPSIASHEVLLFE